MTQLAPKVTKLVSVKEYSIEGHYVWNSNGLGFLYSTVLYNEFSDPVSCSLRLVDAQTGSERILLESPDNCFSAESWSDNNLLKIGVYDKNYDRTLIEYDLNSNNVVNEATATP